MVEEAVCTVAIMLMTSGWKENTVSRAYMSSPAHVQITPLYFLFYFFFNYASRCLTYSSRPADLKIDIVRFNKYL